MSFFTNNRQLIKGLAINTGTTANPVWKDLCCASEIGITTDMEQQDFYVFCDVIQRHLTTGVNFGLSTTIKLDAQNEGVQEILSRVHTLISAGTISQFNNIQVQFDLLTGVNNAVLEYTSYTANVKLALEGLGGAAEDEGEVAFTMTLNGTATS
jgi:hypothetical protein